MKHISDPAKNTGPHTEEDFIPYAQYLLPPSKYRKYVVEYKYFFTDDFLTNTATFAYPGSLRPYYGGRLENIGV